MCVRARVRTQNCVICNLRYIVLNVYSSSDFYFILNFCVVFHVCF